MALIRLILLVLLARPIARFMTGADVIGREHLPRHGPAIIAANHNSHVDTLLLLTIFPPRLMPFLRPAAAADYFLKDPFIGWFSRKLVGIVPVERVKGGTGADVLAPMREALSQRAIVILFPEGTRGPGTDEMGELKGGIARLAEAFPEAPVIPIWIEGAGRVLPKGTMVPVPMNCTVLVGEAMPPLVDRPGFMVALRERLEALKAEAPPQRWR
jgi:1-acyl-sn-glycerol-3-phosphate acyltransferase